LNNCTLSGNSALYGGGVSSSTLNNCALNGNSASYAGGALSATLNNCTLIGNWAQYEGGGVYDGALNNCIVYYNLALSGANYSWSALNYSCTTPKPADGTGNIVAEPLVASASHLSTFSPCRSAGGTNYARGIDLDGEPWVNPPSIGC